MSTRVKHSRCHAVGSPMCIVRVTSVVPMSYCPPESTSSILLLVRVRVGVRVRVRVEVRVGVRVGISLLSTAPLVPVLFATASQL